MIFIIEILLQVLIVTIQDIPILLEIWPTTPKVQKALVIQDLEYLTDP